MIKNSILTPGRTFTKEPIAIIGLGSLFPDSENTHQFWNNIISKHNSIREVSKKRWDPALYYSEDRNEPDKTYSKIGGFINNFEFNPVEFRIPPKVLDQVDIVQQWALLTAKEALEDANYQSDSFPNENCAVIIGNSMGGDRKTEIDLRVMYPLLQQSMIRSTQFKKMSKAEQDEFLAEVERSYKNEMTVINEDSMPGELANVIAGRVASTFNLRGKSMVSDAACASSLAAIDEAYKGLLSYEFDACIVGGSDRSLLPTTYVKFSKIGALSADGSYPFDKRANGFVQGEGAGMMVLKRLSDARRDGDRIYALVIGVGASSDGKGKGITAPNPIGQELAVRRAYEAAGISPADIQLIEAHGTSTKVGDRVEVSTINKVLAEYNVPNGSIALGSIKSQIGHLKSAAGAAGLIKTVLALHHKILPPSINFQTPNPAINWEDSPCMVNSEPREWDSGNPRRAGVSSFGFGGTNYHVVLEEYDPTRSYDVDEPKIAVTLEQYKIRNAPLDNYPVLVSASSADELRGRLGSFRSLLDNYKFDGSLGSHLIDRINSLPRDISDTHRVGLTFKDIDEFPQNIDLAMDSIAKEESRPLAQTRGIFTSQGMKKGKTAFVFPGQGSQYADMMLDLSRKYRVVADTFDEADKILADFLGEPISNMIFSTNNRAEIEKILKQTQITQPAMLIADIALFRLLKEYGIGPDMVAGHSLGEYAALVAAEVLTFNDALMAVAIRGKAMSEVDGDDKGKMAAVSGKLSDIERVLKNVSGYCIAANKNSYDSTVISGSSDGVDEAIELFEKEDMKTVRLAVSAAFHTTIVEPAGIPLGEYLDSIEFSKPIIPITSNVTGEFFPENGEEIRNLMKQQIGASVEWTRQVETMVDTGVTSFFEVGPKRALTSFIKNISPDGLTVTCNHPKKGGIKSFNEAVAAAFCIGYDIPEFDLGSEVFHPDYRWEYSKIDRPSKLSQSSSTGNWSKMGINLDAVVVTGVGVGLPGIHKEVFDENNFDRLFRGENLIDNLGREKLEAQLEKNIRRLIKKPSGDAEFFSPSTYKDVINLAGQAGKFDLVTEFDVNPQLAAAYDSSTSLAIAAGLLALRDAGIPLVRAYKRTSTGSFLPGGWELPLELQDDTGVIFSSAFPGYNSLAHEMTKFNRKKYDEKAKRLLNQLYSEVSRRVTSEKEKKYLLNNLEAELRLVDHEDEEYHFNRKILLEVLSMGHSQFAQLIKARGPNTQINAACASTTQAIGLGQDWIRTGRCKRVIIISADNITSDDLFEWLGSGFLASGAAAIKDRVEEAALPFDRRRDGMIIGMGAAALVLETEEEANRRGVQPIVEVMGAYYSNSSFHGTRLDVGHVSSELGKFLDKVSAIYNIKPSEMAKSMMFMSHETYTPRRGGSASAEIRSLRENFGENAAEIHIANTKGFTGHAMGAGIEDVVAIRAVEMGMIPPIANFKIPDPDLGDLKLSKGGAVPVDYALRLAAGFGSQVAFALYKKRSSGNRFTSGYNAWLKSIGGNRSDLYKEGKSLRLRDRGSAIPTKIIPERERKITPVVPTRLETPVKVEVKQQGSKSISGKDEILNVLIDEIAAATGYSKDMIEPDLELEADLGIDSVKSAEVFGTIREKYDLEQDDDLDISQYASINAMAEYFASQMGTPVTSVDTTSTADTKLGKDNILEVLIEEIADATGYSKDMIEPDLELEADLGVDSVKTAEVFGTIREKYNLEQDDDVDISAYPTIESMAEYFASQMGSEASQISEKVVSHTSEDILSGNEILEVLIDEIASATGYTKDMIEPDLELEADLGVDSVKTAEIFGTIREKYSLEQDEDMDISAYPTIKSMAEYFASQMGGSMNETIGSTPVIEVESTPKVDVQSPPAGFDEVLEVLIEEIADATGYTKDMIEPSLELEADLGVDSVKTAEVFGTIREKYSLEQDEDMDISAYPTIKSMAEYFASQMTETKKKIPVTEQKEITKLVSPPPNIRGKDRLMQILGQMTGYPASIFDPYVSLTEDLGIDEKALHAIHSQLQEEFNTNVSGDTVGKLIQSLGMVESAETSVKSHDISQIDELKNILSTLSGLPVTMIADYVTLVEDLGFDQATYNKLSNSIKQQLGIDLKDVQTIKTIGDLIKQITGTSISKPTGSTTIKSTKKIENEVTEGSIDEVDVRSIHRYILRYNKLELKRQDAEFSGYFVARKNDQVSKLSEDLNLTLIPSLKSDTEILPSSTLVFYNPTERSSGSPGDIFEILKKNIDNIIYLVLMVRTKSKSMDPYQGALGGIFKALAKEFDHIRAKLLIVDSIDQLENEINSDTVEVYYGKNRTELALREQYLSEINQRLPEDAVLLASGGAQGITFEMIREIASTGNIFVLLGRTRIREDAQSIASMNRKQKEMRKKELLVEMKKSGDRVTPIMLNREWAKYTKSATIWKNINTLEEMGVGVIYQSVDVKDEEEVTEAFDIILNKLKGREINYFIHGAGVEISRPTKSKSRDEFDLVYDIKVKGWENLLSQMNIKSLRRIIAFTSVAGRFGNATQVDYSAANEYLAKSCAIMRDDDINATAIDWSAWAGTGMATRGSTMKILEAAGVTAIPKDEGIQAFVSEFFLSSEYEVVISGELGGLAESATWYRPDFVKGIMIDELSRNSSSRILSLERDMYLDDHRIDGKAVLPGVMGLESMAQLVRATSNETVTAFHNINFSTPVKLPRDRDLEIITQIDDIRDYYQLELKSKFLGPDGKQLGDLRPHFSASLVTGERISGYPVETHDISDSLLTSDEIYKLFFHGPSYQVLEDLLDISEYSALVSYANPKKAMFSKIKNYEIEPLYIEAAFQAAGLHLMLTQGIMGLPSRVGSIFLYKPSPVVTVKVNYINTLENHSYYNVVLLNSKGETVVVLDNYVMIHTGDIDRPEIRLNEVDDLDYAFNLAGSVSEYVFAINSDALQAVSEKFVDEFLIGKEMDEYNSLQGKKRKTEWLAGRIVAKYALSDYLIRDPHRIEIQRDENKSPFTIDLGNEFPVSISHSGGIALAIANDFAIDIEKVEKRNKGFVKLMFTEKEQEFLENASKTDITKAFSMKEAHLKRLRIGWRVKVKEVILEPIDDNRAIVSSKDGASDCFSIFDDDWVITLASEHEE